MIFSLWGRKTLTHSDNRQSIDKATIETSITIVTADHLMKYVWPRVYGQSILGSQGSDWSEIQRESKRKNRDNGREGRIIYIDLTYRTHLSFISLQMMTHFVYSSILLLLFFIVNEAKKPDDPLQGMFKKLIEIVLIIISIISRNKFSMYWCMYTIWTSCWIGFKWTTNLSRKWTCSNKSSSYR